jgi:hypothetical protein
MSKIVSLACATAIAVVATLAVTAPSSADPRGDAAGAAIAGGVLGFMAGAAAANSAPPPPPHHFHGGWHDHVRMCMDHYGWRYDPRSDLVRWHGRVFRCDDWPGRGYPPPPRGYDRSPPPPPDYGPPDDDGGY